MAMISKLGYDADVTINPDKNIDYQIGIRVVEEL